ncbi:MAG: glycosyltransferase [Limisphaerales bacterium]
MAIETWYDPRFVGETEKKPSAMKSLTVVFTTSRPEPEFDWFMQSLHPQINDWEHVEVFLLDTGMAGQQEIPHPEFPKFKRVLAVQPKPNVWQGPHRITTQDWWAKSSALNTSVCFCNTDWISFVDDRCVLLPPWLEAVRAAMEQDYAVCGSYEKRTGMTVENGVIRNGGIVVGRDNRDAGWGWAQDVGAGYWYGCTNALPLEWILAINGFPEKCDSVSFEDIITGHLLKNSGRTIRFDNRMKIIEDRSVEKLGPVMKRSSKEKHPHDVNDKTHAILKWAQTATRSDNPFEIREVRERALRGESFPVPDPATDWRDWFDGQRLREM